MLTASAIVALALAGQTLEVPGDHNSLASALLAAAPDDSIRLAEGVWNLPPGLAVTVPLLGRGPNTILTRSSGSAVIEVDGADVVVRNLALQGDGRPTVQCTGGGSVVLSDVVLTGGGPPVPPSAGGGLVVLNDCTAALERVTLDAVDPGTDGGQVHAVDASLTIFSSTFRQGKGVRGGALFQQGGQLFLFDSVVEGAEATGDGGGLYLSGVEGVVTGTTFADNRAPSGVGGGLVQLGGTLVISASSFSANTAAEGAGAVVAELDGVLEVALSQFDANTSDGAGALACGAVATCVIVDATFQGNSGGAGGATAFAGEATWQRSTFCDNGATVPYGASGPSFGAGGAVLLVDGPGSRRGEANIYVRNAAELGGGAVHALASDVVLRHATLVANEGGLDGSGVEAATGDLLVENSAVVDHSATAALHAGTATFRTSHDLFWNNLLDATFPLDPTDLFQDPLLVDVTSPGCDRGAYVPLAGSPLIDAGTGPNDADGTPPDIGATGGPIGGAVDNDGDGIPEDADCDDGDPTKNVKALVFPDADGDGWGGPFASGIGCPGPGETFRSGDCDDTDSAVNPDAAELLGNGIDDDCDGVIDAEGDTAWYADLDGDGFGDPDDVVFDTVAPKGRIDVGGDCDDSDPYVNPAAVEVCGGVDEDCDGLEDDEDPDVTGGGDFWGDFDGDGFGDPAEPKVACVAPLQTVPNADDCDDANAAVNPGADEVCNTIDDDCDTLVDDDDDSLVDGQAYYVDDDGDGHPGTLVQACEAPPGSALQPTDCDDTRDDVSPDADEVCDAANVDEDCDGLADDLDDDATGQTSFPLDADGDGYGADGGTTVSACDPPAGASAEGGDCNDDDPTVNPGATERWYDGVDQDCDGNDDDQDGDGYGNGPDCADKDRRRNPGALDIPDDGIDQDCDGVDAAFSYRAGACGCSSDAPGRPMGSWWALSRRR